PTQVLAYLGRYASRIALSNDRLVALQDGQVTFRWKDRAHGNAPRLATLDATAFLRRFLLHVLPRRFVRIRHYGFLANAVRPQKLPRVRQWLAPVAVAVESNAPLKPERWEALLLRLTGRDVTRCPRCGVGCLLVVETLPALTGLGDPSRRARSP
ncbi:MAG: transposase, partial [Candidatus Rokubacteria bacterium]|nr:transposase [Candidatus Rokubacteria bacterium]